MTTAKNKKTSIKSLLSLVAYVLLIFISAYSVSDGAGLLRTLPCVLFLPAAATFLINRKRLTVVFCTISTLALCLVESGSVENILLCTVAAACFSALGIFAKRLLVTAAVNRSAKRICLFLAAALTVLSALAYFFFFGNPVSCVVAKFSNQSYMQSRYGESAPGVSFPSYDFSEKKYFSSLSFVDDSNGGARITALVSADEDGKYDGYRNYYEYKLLSERRNELEKYLSENLTNISYDLRNDSIDKSASLTSESTVEELCDKMNFKLAFVGGISDKENFAEQCARICELLSSDDIKYSSLTFYGGIADRFSYSLKHDCGESVSAIDVSEIDEPAFGRDFSEEDNAYLWRRGT